ncbi:hypothetical protein B0O99DRAFT_247117 [Bisporella sp. PMI_857]|nr:hypothetical protein B0O99DRAFT_247117 [Bisporella sp. PMI_857]
MKMSMEIQAYEFTIEDVLDMHRGWIEDLFVCDQKSEAEIVQLLYERRFVVTIAQIHERLLSWGLITTPEAVHRHTTSPRIPNYTIFGEAWTRNQSHMPMSPITDQCEPRATDLYRRRALPSLPSASTSTPTTKCSSHKNTKYPKGKLFDKARLQLTYGTELPDVGEAYDADCNYVWSDQSFEQTAGLESVPRTSLRRADNLEGSITPQTCRPPRTGRRDKKDKESERNGKRH